jgi:hypothetical protein
MSFFRKFLKKIVKFFFVCLWLPDRLLKPTSYYSAALQTDPFRRDQSASASPLDAADSATRSCIERLSGKSGGFLEL